MARWILLMIGCSYGLLVQGQQTLRPNLYGPGQALNYYNTAAGLPDTTTRHSLLLYGQYKSVDSDVWSKPVTVFANYIGQLKNQAGFYSVGYLNDSYSFYTRQTLYTGYTQQVRVLGRRTLSVGVRAVFNLDRIRWKDWQLPGRSGTDSHFGPDLDVGVAYQGNHLALGLSAKNLLGNTVHYDGEVLLTNQRELYLSLSYGFLLGRQVTIAPFALIRLERNLDADLGAYVELFRRVSVGYQFRVWELRSIYRLAVNPYKGFRLGISYDQSLVHRDHNLDALIGYGF
ncbi:type IX secretion system membrane protein PorP/SprF [Spirosoma sp. HMF4905]|uniref:Type IX secretion system membrane protein PorP/SprF n=1 Tax=Spirosoma arboris TaxID=2682092 RepID=A0A7K1SKW7_9BACT|nr:type IX secretion system membrane protein PorP/SprF [Spirosoma arboris]MVM34450.1 type IX secretion system membrane protein PorP/SprF [Spirosoma arboris]